jgi:hypothetical protein
MADRLTIEKGRVTVTLEEGPAMDRPEAELLEMMRSEFVPPSDGSALPDGIKFTPEWRDPFLLVVHQMPPQVRRLQWISDDSPSDYGAGAEYRTVRLSLPYTVTFATFYRRGNQLTTTWNNEMYFTNRPLLSLKDRLGYPALLNVSRVERPRRTRSWICTQHFKPTPGEGWAGQLNALLEHVWGSSFNRSSERHEGASWYGEYRNIHPELHPVARWEEASRRRETYGLSLEWMPTAYTVGELIDMMFEELREEPTGPAKRVRYAKPNPSLIGRFVNHVQKQSG